MEKFVLIFSHIPVLFVSTVRRERWTASNICIENLDIGEDYTMKKKILSIALVLVMAVSLFGFTASAAASMSNFTKTRTYSSGQFTDVDENQWYGFNGQKSLATAYEYGLIQGNSATTFNPTGNITVGEAITLAVRVHSIYNGGTGILAQGDPWYQVYVDYAIANNIIDANDFTNYTRGATRAEMAYVFLHSLPSSQFSSQNTVNYLPDVNSSTAYSESILTLFRAGVVTGNDTNGTYYPGNNIIRAEAATIMSRVILPDLRTSGRTYGEAATTPPPSTGNDTVSMNALVGTWRVNNSGFYIYWEFGNDGRFAYFLGSSMVSSTRYEFFTKGEFRVIESIIELYNCQQDYYQGSSHKYFGDSRSSIPAKTLLNTPLQDSTGTNDFSVKFEFFDTMRLRIICDIDNPIDKYDTRFVYRGDSHNIAIPTHVLPGLAWPKDELPTDIPEFVGGRIWKIESTSGGLRIDIDRTTHAALANYVNLLLTSGWTYYYSSHTDLSDWFVDGEYSYTSFEKDGNSLGVTINEYGEITIVD